MVNRTWADSLAVIFVLLGGSAIPAADWPQWGGTDCRNLVSPETGLPDSFSRGERAENGGLDASTAENVRWIARLGSSAYGNPTVSRGRVIVGTDDLTLGDDTRLTRTKGGLVKCFDEATGELQWQLVVPQRTNVPDGVHFVHQYLGTCSSTAVDGDRAYVVTSANDVVCLDVKGLADGNDGPFLEEGQYIVGPGRAPVELTDLDADIVWRYDLMDELGVCPHDAASCSILIHGDVLYLSTSNGVDKAHAAVVAPDAPAFVALDKHTGRLAAVEREGISSRLYHAQWSSPSLGRVGDKTLVFVGGGDGVCYAFEALAEVPEQPVALSKVWSYDGNPPSYRYRDGEPIPYYAGDRRKSGSPNKNDGLYVGPNQIIATPVFHKGRVYVAIGQDPAHGRGKGLLHCIDAAQTGDITDSGCIWKYDGLDRSMATVAVADGLLYVPDIAGRLHCLDADNGECYWVHDTKAETWGGPLLADGKIFLGTKRSFFILASGKQPRVLSQVRLGSPAYSTPIAANGTVYVASQQYLWAVAATQTLASGH